MLTEDLPAAARQHFLNNIIEQNQRQKQLIDKLLALIKIEQQHSLEQHSIDLASLLALVKADAHVRLQEKALDLHIELAPDLVRIKGDALLLRQALGNLLDNAIAFAPHGSHIILSASQDNQAIALSVSDRGPGIPDYAQQRIFERFYSLARPDAAKSTGLGLPLVREVALLHGGSISVSNRAEGGACACLRLPLP
ncbi:hypothetical protein EJG51_010925 [Undibacterium piscinae]|uniref:histidine kinase n=1 Tax=Undibacterium piscinae TaxID=2495591 RepID=A0A6M4A8B5_9BURK|nr:hypothetical protein EJG51_010925 [Undibacterium piscinae]